MVVVSFLLLLSGFLSLAGSYHDRNLNQAIPGGGRVSGTVASVRREIGTSGVTFLPVITYRVSGRLYRVDGFPTPTSAVGESVVVSYNRADPAVARDISQAAPPSTRLFVQGTLFVLAGFVVGVLSIRRLRSYLE